MPDNNPFENRVHYQLDRQRERAPFRHAPPTRATDDPVHLMPRRPPPAPPIPEEQEIIPAMPTVVARGPLKVTAVVDPATLLDVATPEGQSRIVLTIKLPDGAVTTDLAMKSVRKAVTQVRELGPDGCAAIVQGRLDGNRIVEAGLTVQPRKTAVEKAEAATVAA